MFAKCTPSGSVQGNILLDFDEDDPLLFLGRLCLAMTITLAFPMLVIPARDILVRSLMGSRIGKRYLTTSAQGDSVDIPEDIAVREDGLTTVEFEPMQISSQVESMEEPLLALENRSSAASTRGFDDFVENRSVESRQVDNGGESDSKAARTIVALFVFWSAAGLACMVQSIDVVWDLVGSSFSIMLAFLIPCGAYLKLAKLKRFETVDGGIGLRKWMVSRAVAWFMLFLFAPLMVISTANAVYNSFFSKND